MWQLTIKYGFVHLVQWSMVFHRRQIVFLDYYNYRTPNGSNFIQHDDRGYIIVEVRENSSIFDFELRVFPDLMAGDLNKHVGHWNSSNYVIQIQRSIPKICSLNEVFLFFCTNTDDNWLFRFVFEDFERKMFEIMTDQRSTSKIAFFAGLSLSDVDDFDTAMSCRLLLNIQLSHVMQIKKLFVLYNL
jgi:hypothetical protein